MDIRRSSVSHDQDQGAVQPSFSPRMDLDTIPFHAKSIETCMNLLGANLFGLDPDEVISRQQAQEKFMAEDQPIAAKPAFNPLKKTVVCLLVMAAILSIIMLDFLGGLTILLAASLYTILNMVTHRGPKKQVQTVETLQNNMVTVKRSGYDKQIAANELVVGDVLVFTAGDTLPVDARLFRASDVKVDEAALSGESILVAKNANDICVPDDEVTEQTNMLFAGTRVKTGHGEAVITAVGPRTVMGKLSQVGNMDPAKEAPFTRWLNQFGLKSMAVISVLAIAVASLEIYRGAGVVEMTRLGIVMLILAMPEILPSVAAFATSLVLEHLGKKQIHVKNPEALVLAGNISVVCTDKTGTLTENALTLRQFYVPGLGTLAHNARWADGQDIPGKSVEELLRIARLNNATAFDGIRSFMMGDPIDVALHRAAPASLEYGYNRIKDIPFDSTTMRSATIYRQKVQLTHGQVAENQPGEYVVSMIKGAPEVVIGSCNWLMKPTGEIVPLTEEERNEYVLINREMALEGAFRVIGFAKKWMDKNDPDGDPYENAVFIGWVCLEDPAKEGVVEGIHQCQRLGVDVVMITGDQKATAAVTAKSLGILRGDNVIWTRDDLFGGKTPPKNVRVFARTKPEDKLQIVDSLQNVGERVAMVGDGVNDAPALQKSDLAIAMGLKGSETAKEAADILLLNERFGGIVDIITASRILNHNIRLTTGYLLSSNFAILALITFSAVLGFALPLLGLSMQMEALPLNALQVLWLSIFTVTFPAFSLAAVSMNNLSQANSVQQGGFYPGASETLSRSKPDNSRANGLLNGHRFFLIYFLAFLMACAGLGTFVVSVVVLELPPDVAGTLTFCTMAFAQTLNLLNIQSLSSRGGSRSIVKEMFTSPILWLVGFLALALQVAAVYVPVLQQILSTTPIDPTLWVIPAGFAVGMTALSLVLIDTRALD
ncbi:MAG: cation-transporting P-type ATPase [Vampirovibrio sp.]|nr:cation-transporting P-type ATPase [Vampirovibrio sp.]